MKTTESPGLVNWLLILALGMIWGTAFMGVDLALRDLPPLWVSAGRTALGSLALLAVGTVSGQGPATIPPGPARRIVPVIGFFIAALPFTLLSYGQQYVPSAFAGVAMGAVPLLTLLLVMKFSPEEGVGPRRIAGVSLGFAGLAVLVGPGAFDPGTGEAVLWGRAACVLAASCYAISNILTRRAPPMPPLAMATGVMGSAALMLVPLALIVEGLPHIEDPKALAALVWVALGPTALAALIQIRVIRSAGALFVSLVSYMVPVWSVIFGIVLLDEDLPPQLFYALGLIFGGIALSQWSRARRAPKR